MENQLPQKEQRFSPAGRKRRRRENHWGTRQASWFVHTTRQAPSIFSHKLLQKQHPCWQPCQALAASKPTLPTSITANPLWAAAPVQGEVLAVRSTCCFCFYSPAPPLFFFKLWGHTMEISSHKPSEWLLGNHSRGWGSLAEEIAACLLVLFPLRNIPQANTAAPLGLSPAHTLQWLGFNLMHNKKSFQMSLDFWKSYF